MEKLKTSYVLKIPQYCEYNGEILKLQIIKSKIASDPFGSNKTDLKRVKINIIRKKGVFEGLWRNLGNILIILYYFFYKKDRVFDFRLQFEKHYREKVEMVQSETCFFIDDEKNLNFIVNKMICKINAFVHHYRQNRHTVCLKSQNISAFTTA